MRYTTKEELVDAVNKKIEGVEATIRGIGIPHTPEAYDEWYAAQEQLIELKKERGGIK